jgi:hypothetical protein
MFFLCMLQQEMQGTFASITIERWAGRVTGRRRAEVTKTARSEAVSALSGINRVAFIAFDGRGSLSGTAPATYSGLLFGNPVMGATRRLAVAVHVRNSSKRRQAVPVVTVFAASGTSFGFAEEEQRQGLSRPLRLRRRREKGTAMSFGIYIVGFLILIGGLIYGAVILHIAAQWIAVGAIVLFGLAILKGVQATRGKDPSK